MSAHSSAKRGDGRGKTRGAGGLPDLIAGRPRALFVGINPGIRSAALGHHFAGHSNRFWRLLWESGLVPERLTFMDDVRLPDWGYGITNLVPRPTPGIGSLRPAEYRSGSRRLASKVRRRRPELVVLVGVTIFRALCPDRRGRGPRGAGLRPVRLGLQKERFAGVPVFVLPNPSGRNATLSHAAMRAAFRALRRHLDTGIRAGPSR